MSLRLPSSAAAPLLRKLIAGGLDAADPLEAIARTLHLAGNQLCAGQRTYDLTRFDRVVVVGAGKASARMAQGLETLLGRRIDDGFVVVKQGHVERTTRIRIVEAGHPVPDRAGLAATEVVLRMAGALTRRDLLIVLLSGGASSLWAAPVPRVSLAATQHLTKLLLRSGAAIHEINAVRKHLSRIKGGRLAASTSATILTLILSDVIGDDLGSIGSGPTAVDTTSFAEAVAVLRRYAIWKQTPAAVRSHLMAGCRGLVPETRKRSSRRVHHEIIGNNRVMLDAVAKAARAAGLTTLMRTRALTGEARKAAERFAALALRRAAGTPALRRPCCVIAGGETTVTVTGRGTGGRAQEFAVAGALAIAGLPRVWLAALGTDGTDGPTDVAGGLVSGETAARAHRMRVNLHRALTRHDTYPCLHRLGCHIVTGPTGTNVNDLYLMLLL